MAWAENPDTGERALKRVVQTFLNEKDELVHVQVGDETITCTTEHPFYVHDKGWVAAIDLKPHDQLELRNGKASFVHSIRIEKLDQPIQVYNFEVEDFHTYFVGENCVLVHNSCAHNKEWNRERRKYWRNQAEQYLDDANNQLSKSGTYRVTEDNLQRMRRGSAPIGTDNLSVALHHRQGISIDFYDYEEILTSVHRSKYKLLHTWVN